MTTLKGISTVLALCYVAGAYAAQPATLTDKMMRCGQCHSGPLALTGKPAEEVLAGLQRIHKGKQPHPPGVQSFSAEELAEVAAILSGAPAAENLN